MGFFQEYQTGIETYVRDHVAIEIVDVELDSPADGLSAGEVAWFKIEIHNTGPVDMADITVRVRGCNGAKVRSADVASQWTNEFTTEAGRFPLVPGHNDNNPTTNSGRFSLLAPPNPQPRRVLVDATVEAWSPELTHLHHGHANSRSHRSDRSAAHHEDAVRPNHPLNPPEGKVPDQ